MRIELQWAFVEQDIKAGPCAVCEDCLRWFSRRKVEDNVPAPWPTWEEYRALVESHQEPMFASPEEMWASEPIKDPHWSAYDRSWLWVAKSGC